MTILSCPGCSRNLRVPDNKRGKVTCPVCSAEWFHPEVIELSSVEFRCASSGARFNVISSRRSPLHTFTVQKIEKAVSGGRSPDGSPSTSTVNVPHHPPPALAAIAPRVGWLARITGRAISPLPARQPERPTDPLTPEAVSANTNDAAEYNWSGFCCPYCRASSFISCGSGGHLACDGTIQMRNGERFHQCFCGHASFISGSIKSFENRRMSVKRDAAEGLAGDSRGEAVKTSTAAVVSPTPSMPAKR